MNLKKEKFLSLNREELLNLLIIKNKKDNKEIQDKSELYNLLSYDIDLFNNLSNKINKKDFINIIGNNNLILHLNNKNFTKLIDILGEDFFNIEIENIIYTANKSIKNNIDYIINSPLYDKEESENLLLILLKSNTVKEKELYQKIYNALLLKSINNNIDLKEIFKLKKSKLCFKKFLESNYSKDLLYNLFYKLTSNPDNQKIFIKKLVLNKNFEFIDFLFNFFSFNIYKIEEINNYTNNNLSKNSDALKIFRIFYNNKKIMPKIFLKEWKCFFNIFNKDDLFCLKNLKEISFYLNEESKNTVLFKYLLLENNKKRFLPLDFENEIKKIYIIKIINELSLIKESEKLKKGNKLKKELLVFMDINEISKYIRSMDNKVLSLQFESLFLTEIIKKEKEEISLLMKKSEINNELNKNIRKRI